MFTVRLRCAGSDGTVEVRLDGADAAGGQALRAQCGSAALDVEVLRLTSGGGCLRVNGRVVRFHAIVEGGRVEVWLEGSTYQLEVVDQKARRQRDVAKVSPSSELTAPLPGSVLKIEVGAGDSFVANEPLIIIESMKMEMTLSSPCAGTVKEIRCKVGELVPLGHVLAKLEVSEGDGAS